jgi:hypothetical protein
MKHFDYDWDLYPDRIILDQELNIDRLGWKGGDYFKLVNIDGKAQLIKQDPLVQFIKDGEQHVQTK